MSTCLISTWTSYTCLSDCCVPWNLLPGRKYEDGEIGIVWHVSARQNTQVLVLARAWHCWIVLTLIVE